MRYYQLWNNKNIIAALSERKDGPMKFSRENRKRFLTKLDIKEKSVIRAGLIHGNRVEIVSKDLAGKIIEKTDGLLTKDKNLFLTLTVADCLPIFIYDPEKEIVGLVHAGWRSLAQNILKKALKNLSKNTKVFIGPGIGVCHFEVKKDLLEKFKPYLKQALLKRNGKHFLDLKKISKLQLIDLGLKRRNIGVSPECTFCLKDKYFSFRCSKPKKIQTMLVLIGRK